jgi:hypothetical protein
MCRRNRVRAFSRWLLLLRELIQGGAYSRTVTGVAAGSGGAASGLTHVPLSMSTRIAASQP